MDPRTKRYVYMSIFVGLLIVLLLLFLFLRDGGESNQNNNPVDRPPIPETDNTIESEVIVAPTPFIEPERDVAPGTADQGLVAKQAARIFVERFGTYSSQNDNSHIAAVQELATDSMLSWVNTQEQAQSLRAYTGVTTEVIALTLTDFTPATADVSIEARQTLESEESVETRARNGRVELIRSGDDWLVDGFFWDN